MRPLRSSTAALAAVTVVAGAALGSAALVSPALAAPAVTASAPGTAAARTTVGGPTLDLPGVHTRAKPGAVLKPVPSVSGESWVIADANTGEIIASKNAHTQLRPASTLKTLTAVTLLPQLDPKKLYTPVYADISAEGSKVGIVGGSTYTIDQLWYGLFLASGNDTAHALALANGGMVNTVTQMNAKARQLQAFDTVAKTPSGLDKEGQHSSAYDLALISRAGLKMPQFAKYCGTVSVKFPAGGKKAKRKTFMVYNHNPLVIGNYKGAIGVKTGYTDLARRTFVGAAKQGNRTLIVTIMKYEGNTYRTAEALLDWGFKNAPKAEPVGRLVEPLPAAQAKATTTAGKNAKSKQAAATNGFAGIAGDSKKPPLWPFILLAAGFLAVLVWALRGRFSLPESDPLAAANKGLGGRGNKPRGRGGPRSY